MNSNHIWKLLKLISIVWKCCPKLGYKCNYNDCKFICITPHLISEHTLSHSMGKAFECDLCHKTYTLKNHLNNHKKLVHNINNKCPLLQCMSPECDYNTRNPYCFRQHERTHQTDTPFKCSEDGCEKSFKTNISLKQHINNFHMSVNLLACSWQRRDCYRSDFSSMETLISFVVMQRLFWISWIHFHLQLFGSKVTINSNI